MLTLQRQSNMLHISFISSLCSSFNNLWDSSLCSLLRSSSCGLLLTQQRITMRHRLRSWCNYNSWLTTSACMQCSSATYAKCYAATRAKLKFNRYTIVGSSKAACTSNLGSHCCQECQTTTPRHISSLKSETRNISVATAHFSFNCRACYRYKWQLQPGFINGWAFP